MNFSPDEEKLIEMIAGLAKGRPQVIAIGGVPGAGKTTLTKKLIEYFAPRALHISEDDVCALPTALRKSYLQEALDHNDKERLRYLAAPTDPADNPHANPLSWYDWEDLRSCLSLLKNGQVFERANGWDQKTGLCNRAVQHVPPQDPSPLFFVDTNYPLECGAVDLLIMLETSPEIAAEGQRRRDAHRSEQLYMEYKKIVDALYCAPAAQRLCAKADFIMRRGVFSPCK